MNIKKLLGKKLQQIRKHNNLTQEKLAEMIGLDTSSISHIENGKYYPNAENLEKIIKALDIRPSDIFSFESLAPVEDLLSEMISAMQKDEQLVRQMYKFFSSIKY